jgi:peptide methionine sulfoxide reductase msrA/msrB
LNRLTPQELEIIEYKGTEAPFSGKYNSFYESGIYSCKRCNKELFRSDDKFNSSSGWPSFDDSIKGAVKEIADSDGVRVEIVCANCGGHLGHVFYGEEFTPKNTRHCVNSLSLGFNSYEDDSRYKKAYFAAGCFWGVEYWFDKLDGVLSADSGYMGGETKKPTYRDLCYGDTGHLEVVKVIYDPSSIAYEALVKLFFEIHDPQQTNGQGPDIGSQYLSAILYSSDDEKEIAQKLIDELESSGLKIATSLIDANNHKFYKAELEHQNYYKLRGSKPYCHTYVKRFYD